ncbi:MAG: hypothetical protein AAF663_09790 [Planctomycetota bacterium]
MYERRAFTLGELIAACVAVGLLVVVVLTLQPSLSRSRETANLVKCASNLRQIGLAAILYSMDNNNAFPSLARDFSKPPTAFSGWDSADPWAGPEPNDITAAWYMLVRTQDIDPGVFLCPSEVENHARVRPWDFASKPVEQTSNFPHAGFLSYSFANPYSESPDWTWDTTVSVDMPLAADRNPGGEAVVDATLDWSAQEMKSANSPNHGNEGQNVLYADGHITFENTPFVGIRRDNIFTTGTLGKAGDPARRTNGIVNGFPIDRFDAVLLPAAPDHVRPLLPFWSRQSTRWWFNGAVVLLAITLLSVLAYRLKRASSA